MSFELQEQRHSDAIPLLTILAFPVGRASFRSAFSTIRTQLSLSSFRGSTRVGLVRIEGFHCFSGVGSDS